MNYKIMRSGYFYILKRIQLFTDIGEHPLIFLNFEQYFKY